MKKMNVGYIGWLSHDDTEFSKAYAICNLQRNIVDDYLAKYPEVKVFDDWRDMADDPRIDVVIVSTPNTLHCPMAELLLAKGKHVFCEKPMGLNKDELDRMLLAERKSGKKLAIDFELRLADDGIRFQEIIRSGELGEIKGAEFTHHRGGWLNEGNCIWRLDPKTSGGLFFMEPCHEVDIFRMLLGEITHAQSFKFPNTLPQYEPEMPDNVTSHFFFANGAHGIISTSHALSVSKAKAEDYPDQGHDMVYVFYGTKGAMRFDCINGHLLVTKQEPYPAGRKGVQIVFDRIEKLHEVTKGHSSIETNRQGFIKACAEGRDHQQTAEDAWRTHRVCLAAEKSALNGFRKVKVDYSL